MRLKAVSPTADCSRHAFQPFAPSSFFTSSSSFRLRNPDMDKPVSSLVLSNPFASKTLLKSRSFNKISRRTPIRRSCSLNLDEEPSSFYIEGSVKSSSAWDEDEGRRNMKRHCAISKNSSFLGGQGSDEDAFLHSRFDFLEPMMIGIGPELSDWPYDYEELATWATVKQKAKSLDIPMSLKIIKKKLQMEEDFVDYKGLDTDQESEFCSVKAAFASMVFIIVELQTCALRMREAMCDDNLEIITSKVQKEMHLSFAWLFQRVFSRTPILMLHVMMLLANFGVHSASSMEREASLFIESLNALSADKGQDDHNQQINSSLLLIEEETEAQKLKESVEFPIAYPDDELLSEEEMDIWNSMVDDATNLREGSEDAVVDPEDMQIFVSPVSVGVEADTYQDFLRTDLFYQMNLTQDPDNALLLCNYAQFLHLVAHDYRRSEECFKRAVQLTPPDPECLAQYANFLWTVRQDYWAAEESFLQALALEPHNQYYASRYASFLWSTGGEETCFPLNNV